jgi:hypothetical protein
VREAALARVSGGTIERVETDADGHAAYEAHMTDADGNRITVYPASARSPRAGRAKCTSSSRRLTDRG